MVDGGIPLSIAADRGAVCFHDGGAVVCCDRETGQTKWRAPTKVASGSLKEGWNNAPFSIQYTLALHQGNVFFVSPREVVCLAAEKANDKVFAAGPPNVLDPKDPLGALEGRKGGVAQSVRALDS